MAAGLLSCITYTKPHVSCYTALVIYILLKPQFCYLKLRHLGAQTDIHFYISFDVSFSSVGQFIAHAKSQHLGISNSYHLFIKGEWRLQFSSFFVSFPKRCGTFRGWSKKFLFLYFFLLPFKNDLLKRKWYYGGHELYFNRSNPLMNFRNLKSCCKSVRVWRGI